MANCWKGKIRRGFGYKEIALHRAVEHGLFEKMAERDERPEIRTLLQQLQLS